MRFALLSALGAIITTLATPSNTSAVVSLSSNSSDERRIPVEQARCYGDSLNKDWYLGSRNNLTEWSLHTKGVSPGRHHAEIYPETEMFGVTWYVCNCKYIHHQKVLAWELEDVQRILNEKCGEYQSGYVWSGKWSKGYSVVTNYWYIQRILNRERLCPIKCTFF
ncbi:hypothetical protein GGR51DRAFT_562258 [Nemania sp. FL0031]|nr:hypothetical protein GGR51DRAFT_562258 [Nemania sp. FL0031]